MPDMITDLKTKIGEALTLKIAQLTNPESTPEECKQESLEMWNLLCSELGEIAVTHHQRIAAEHGWTLQPVIKE